MKAIKNKSLSWYPNTGILRDPMYKYIKITSNTFIAIKKKEFRNENNSIKTK